MIKIEKDSNLMCYLPEPIQFPYQDIDDYVSDPDLKKAIEYDYLTFNFEEAIKKAFAHLGEKVVEMQNSESTNDVLSIINSFTLDMKLKGALLLIQCESPESRMQSTLYTFKFAEITLRLLDKN